MHERIDIYLKQAGRWLWIDATRRFTTLADAQRWAEGFFGEQVQARWSER